MKVNAFTSCPMASRSIVDSSIFFSSVKVTSNFATSSSLDHTVLAFTKPAGRPPGPFGGCPLAFHFNLKRGPLLRELFQVLFFVRSIQHSNCTRSGAILEIPV